MSNESETAERITKKLDDKIILEPIDVNKTELAYVTSTNKQSRTFFAQFCRFSNDGLIQFNKKLNDYCLKKVEANEANKDAKPIKWSGGDIVCAKFSGDNFWYRAQVLNRCKEDQSCNVMFIDYGNLETAYYDDLVSVNKQEFPDIERCAYGITCFLDGSEKYSVEEANHLLNSLNGIYIMINTIERQTTLQWKVNIPTNAYNIPFWHIFKPEQRQ